MALFLVLGALAHVLFAALALLIDHFLPSRAALDRPVEVVWIEKAPESSEIQLPESVPVTPPPSQAAPPLSQPPPPPTAEQTPPPPPQKKPPPKPKQVELALIPKPPQPVPPPKPLEQQKPPEPEKPKAQLKVERMKKVEVDDDEHVVNEPPPEATYLSDKNRRVKEETRDTKTNLEKLSKGKADASEKSEDKESTEVGGAEEQIHQLEKAQASTLEKKRLPPTVHDGKEQESKGLQSGNKGEAQNGQDGRGGDGGKPGALAMRDVEGRGAPGSEPAITVAPSGAHDDAPEVAMSEKPGEAGETGRAGREGKAGKPGKRGPKLDLSLDDYQRIIGEDALREEIEIARRQTSHKKGRWEKKLERVHAALENFTPEVRPGNQTALGTRAAPFAVFIARMHRQIHELWGFGFLADLDGKSPSNPMNKRDLEVELEIVLNGDGTVDKVTIARPSGILTFDVAAIDTVENAGPFEEPPGEIRSANGKIYMHWTFHRDERQCSPYFADPFILDNPPGPGEDRGLPDPANAVAKRRRDAEQLKRNASPTEGGVSVAHVTRTAQQTADAEAAAARAHLNVPAPDDPAAQAVALKWLDGFEAGRLDVLVGVSGVPFMSSGTVAAADAAGLARMWRNILDESPTRTVKTWKVLSPAGYRAAFGRLPKGADDGPNKLYLAARIGKDWVTLELGPGPSGYQIRGFTR